MADEADRAEIQEQLARDIAINSVRGKKIDMTNHTCKCLYCGEDTGPMRRWCNQECSDLWVRENE